MKGHELAFLRLYPPIFLNSFPIIFSAFHRIIRNGKTPDRQSLHMIDELLTAVIQRIVHRKCSVYIKQKIFFLFNINILSFYRDNYIIIPINLSTNMIEFYRIKTTQYIQGGFQNEYSRKNYRLRALMAERGYARLHGADRRQSPERICRRAL